MDKNIMLACHSQITKQVPTGKLQITGWFNEGFCADIIEAKLNLNIILTVLDEAS